MLSRCFDESTTSSTEGCNAAMKTNSSLSVKPSQGMDTSAKTMTQQLTVQLARKQREAIHGINSTALWSRTKTAPVVTALAEGLMQHQLTQSTCYVAARVNACTFFLRRKKQSGVYMPFDMEVELEGASAASRMPITRFVHVRVIRILRAPDGRWYLECSCCFFRMFGLPCRHIIFLVESIVPEHCAVRWLKQYIAYFKREGYEKVSNPAAGAHDPTRAARSVPNCRELGLARTKVWIKVSFHCG